MSTARVALVSLVILFGAGGTLAQNAPDAAAPHEREDVPCLIDDRLSMWLALESVDRTIAALELERRELAAELATSLQALDVLARADDPDGVPLAELNTLVQAQSAGHEALEDAYAEVQHRLIEIDKTLIRRRKQQAMLETRLEELMETAGGEAAAR